MTQIQPQSFTQLTAWLGQLASDTFARDVELGLRYTSLPAAFESWVELGAIGELPADVRECIQQNAPHPDFKAWAANPQNLLPDNLSDWVYKRPVTGDNVAEVLVAPDTPYITFILEKLLGRGKYGEVWLAERRANDDTPPQRVALKRMNPGLSELDQNSFRAELETLRDLEYAQTQPEDLRVNGHWLTPRLMSEYDLKAEQAWFAQELADGTPLDELQRELGVLAEPDALTIVEQFCRVLSALHAGPRKCYLDFQPRNIFWHDQQRRITVIDWNLLSPNTPKNCAEDMQHAARLLYRLLMGVPAPEPGSPRQLAQPLENWSKLSLGAHDILSQALHLDPTKRFAAPQDMQKAINSVLGLWQADLEALIQDARSERAEAGRDPRPEQLAWVLSAARGISVAQKRVEHANSAPSASLIETAREVQDWLDGRGRLKIAESLLENGFPGDALTTLQQALTDDWSAGVALRASRLIQAAQASMLVREKGRTLPPEVYRRPIALLEQGQYAAVKSEIDQAIRGRDEYGPYAPLIVLSEEASIHLNMQAMAQQDQMGDLAAAIQAGETAQGHWRELSPHYQQALAAEFYGALPERLSVLRGRQQAQLALQHQTQEFDAAFADEFEKGRAALKMAFERDPDSVVLTQYVSQRWRRLLMAGHWSSAQLLVGLLVEYAPGHEDARMGEALQQADRCWNASDDRWMGNWFEALKQLEREPDLRSAYLRPIWAREVEQHPLLLLRRREWIQNERVWNEAELKLAIESRIVKPLRRRLTEPARFSSGMAEARQYLLMIGPNELMSLMLQDVAKSWMVPDAGGNYARAEQVAALALAFCANGSPEQAASLSLLNQNLALRRAHELLGDGNFEAAIPFISRAYRGTGSGRAG